MHHVRHLILVLGDQLDLEAAAFDGFDATHDAVWMAEAHEESTHVWSSKQRITLFLSAMRHFAQALRDAGRPLHYHRLDDIGPVASLDSLGAKLQADLTRLKPQRVVMTAPGDWRVFEQLKAAAEAAGLKLEVCEDRHFFTTVSEFAAHASGRKSLRLEYFYRELRQRYNILMDDGKPAGGQWNFDADNREAFGPQGPGQIPARATFEPDALTQEVIALVNTRFADLPG
jgi:deoxyribodipyrimidine photolyase-related protein